MCPFENIAVAGSGKVGPVNQFNHTSWMAVFLQLTVLSRTFFVALFVLLLCPFRFSDCVGAFVIGLSQISSFFFLLTSGYFPSVV